MNTESEGKRMDYQLFIIFVILNIVNVVIQTIKSLATVNCGKTVAALTNAIAYGLYTVVVVYMVCELPLWLKVVVIALCNLVGVYVVKWLEEKSRKDKLWKVEMALPVGCNPHEIKRNIEQCGISCNYYEVGKWTMYNCYCETQQQTKAINAIAQRFNGKISAYESKNLT